tara:strand:+ start:1261 stop:1371 length:111 start_codon:yes stop_codon:yes gene_type:complete
VGGHVLTLLQGCIASEQGEERRRGEEKMGGEERMMG